jgi:transcriptional regulator with XRE-family HTH domain
MTNKTSDQKSDARRLKAAIVNWQAARKTSGLPSSYAHLGAMVGGISQSAVSQYANGDIPLNARSLELFSSALGVAPESISSTVATRIVANSNARLNLRGMPAPGMVYDWREIQYILETSGTDKLPDMFSVELITDLFHGLVSAGDAIVLSRIDKPRPGDGAIIRHKDGRIEPCIYRPGRHGDYYAQVPDGTLLHSRSDDVEYLFTVVGMPTLRWSRLVR